MCNLLKIFACVITFAVFPTVWADWYFQTGFLDKFMTDQSLVLMGTILAIYIAASASFILILMAYEDSKQKKIFKGTIAELKQNIACVTILFFIHFLLLVATQKVGSGDPSDIPQGIQISVLMFKSLKVFTFSVYIFALYELNNVLFGIRDQLPLNEPKG